jgi:hypothetical protein
MATTNFKINGEIKFLVDSLATAKQPLEYSVQNAIDLHNNTFYKFQNNEEREIILEDTANYIAIKSDQNIKILLDIDIEDRIKMVTFDEANNLVTVTGAAPYYTGTTVRFTTSATLPSELAIDTDYYIISYSPTQFKVASSLLNAQAGTAIDFTDNGTGTHQLVEQESFYSKAIDDQIETKHFILLDTNVKRIHIKNSSGYEAIVRLMAYNSNI